ncbi:hypothetical protein EDD85DRAFT_764124 [Armillaria nabsnona]|nr:hypothetical protein EDD85DRAFT_764124 [Armillaria nabsnona]
MRLRATPAIMDRLLLSAALIAVLHHVYLLILRGRTVSGQFWVKNSSNALSTLVQWLCMGSVSESLTQLIWWFLRRRPFTIFQLNHLFGLPDPLRILGLVSSRRLGNVIPVIFIAALLQAFALVSILAPNSLEVSSASPKSTMISVPTVYFSKTNPSDFQCNPFPGSTALGMALSQAFQSDRLLGWKAPAGCGTACNYTIQYPAPALRCTGLDTDEVDTMVPSDDDLTTLYNATYNIDSTPFSVTNMTMAWRTYDANGKLTIGGARCSLYNTTQQSVVSFVNNFGTISPSIISYNDPINSGAGIGCNSTSLQDEVPDPLLISYAIIETWLYNQLAGSIMIVGGSTPSESAITTDTSVFHTTLFSLNETARTLTPKSKSLGHALEQILVNATVALITSLGQTTTVNALVPQLVWAYHGQSLWIIYATALVVTAVCRAVGLACMLEDGEENSLDFWDIVRATRSSELDAIVDGDKRGDAGKDTMLQYAVQGKDSDANASGVFVLARPRHTGANCVDVGS